jgi:hypothetical protein
MKSNEYQILTGQHRDEESFSATKLPELPSASCYHQKQHLLKSEACNTMTYIFSAKEAKNSSEEQKIQLQVLDSVFQILTHVFSGGFFAQKSVGSFKDLSKLSSTLQHLLTTSD